MRLRGSLALPGPLLAVALMSCANTCTNDVWADVASPDGKLHAVFYVRGCGALTKDQVMVSVLRTGAPAAGPGNALAAWIVSGEPESAIRLAWSSSNELHVTWNARLDVASEHRQVSGASVIHEGRPEGRSSNPSLRPAPAAAEAPPRTGP